jgi:hypothetical protein
MKQFRIGLKGTTLIPSLIIALFVALGVSLDLTAGLNPFFSLTSQTATVWGVFFVTLPVAYFIISRIYGALDAWQVSDKLPVLHKRLPHIEAIEGMYKKHPYLSVYLLFLIVDLPYMIATYPAMFWGDSPAQIMQGYNLKDETASYLRLLNEGVYLNQHHPVPHTLLIHMFVALGKNVFGSYNFGIFLYAFFQFSFITMVIAYIAHYFYEKQLPKLLIIVMLIYFLLSPRIQNHMFLVTKDIIYGGFTMMFILSLFDMLITEGDKVKLKRILITFVSGLGVFLFRNEGRFVGGSVLVLAILFATGKRKIIAGIAIVLFAILFLINGVIYPAFNVSPGSRREKMCLPSEQTALYLLRHADEVTDEEKEIIGKVFNYEEMLEAYTPKRADLPKSKFNEYCTSEELADYFKVWIRMFFKHPQTYLEATLYQTYGYFYPSAGFLYRVPYQDSTWLMQHTNNKCQEIGADFHHPEVLKWYRWFYEKAFELIARIPPVLLLSLSATYLWSLIVLAFYFIRSRRWGALIISVQLFMQYAVCFAGPLDGTCFRYIYPMAMSLIPLLYMGTFLEAGKDVK